MWEAGIWYRIKLTTSQADANTFKVFGKVWAKGESESDKFTIVVGCPNPNRNGPVAHAHSCGVIHCDIKPKNILLFEQNRLRLTDFGIAKVAFQTMSGSGTGTLGYMAPEQAMGKPSPRSDVFSIGQISYRMFSGQWPEYPFEWPFSGSSKLRQRLHREGIAVLRKSLAIQPRRRYADAGVMLEHWQAVRNKAVRFAKQQRSACTSI